MEADCLLIMFTLSAVEPEKAQHEMLSNAFRALRPGGRLMLRDHGLYDMVQVGLSRIGGNYTAWHCPVVCSLGMHISSGS